MAIAKKNFFKDHYDWLVAAVGVALLVGVGALFATSLDNTPEAARAACESELKLRTPVHKNVPSSDEVFRKLEAVQKHMASPSLLAVPSDTNSCFLASERRVFCKKCRNPISVASKICEECKTPRLLDEATVVPGGIDGDQDGLKDAWKRKYGLNPDDQDADGDLFTNLEEFNAKTNPKDPEDHPDYLDDLTVAGDVKIEPLPFWLIGAVPGGRRMEFMVVDQQKYQGKTNAQKGDEIQYKLKMWSKTGDKVSSGWVLKDFTSEKKSLKRPGAEQLLVKDVYTAVLERTSDKFQLSVKEGVHPVAVQEQLDLQWNRGEGKTFTIAKGSEFELNKRKYKVEELKKDRVTIVDLKTNEKRDFGEKASDSKSQAKSASAAKSSPGSKPSPNRKSVP